MSFSTTQTTLNYHPTNRILNTNSLHFILISLLFIPLTFAASAAVNLYFSLPSISSPRFDIDNDFDPFNLRLFRTIISSFHNQHTFKTVITVLTDMCSVITSTVAGVALITYSTNQAINHRHLTFSSTLKSLSRSFIPLLYTVISGLIILITVFLMVTLSSIGIKALGSHFGLPNIALFIYTILFYALVYTILFLITIWGSAAAITMFESKSGFKALLQSMNQSTEFRRHSFGIVYLTGFVVGTALVCSNVFRSVSGPAANWFMVVKTGAVYLQSSLMIVFYVVANTVLYVQYKVAAGEEVAMTSVEGEVSGEYVKVVVNDTESEVVNEVEDENCNGGFNYLFCLLAFVWVILLCAQLYYHPVMIS